MRRFNWVKQKLHVIGNIAPIATALAFAADNSYSKQPEHAGWVQTKGKGYAICDGLLKQLRRYKTPDPLKSPNVCAGAAVMNYPGLSEPPWQDIDVRQHEELLFQFQRVLEIGPKNYAAGIKSRTDHGYEPRPESYSRDQVRNFIASGGTIQVWRTPLPEALSLLKNGPDTSGPLNLINVRWPIKDSPEGLGQCPQVPKIRWGGHVRLANAELTTPDPRQFTEAGAALQNMNGNVLLFFGGVLYRFQGYGSGISITRDDIPPQDWAGDFCRLEYRYPKVRKD